MAVIIEYITGNYIELLAMALGLVSIVLQIKQNLWLWPVNIVMVSLYIIVYIDARLYADMSLQVYYLIMSVYGWFYWLYGRKNRKDQKQVPVTRTRKKVWPFLILATIALFVIISYILVNYTDSDVPYLDAFTTSLSFVATWMLARKLIENWIIWIVVDAVSVGLYIFKGLFPTTVLFLVLTILAFKGYHEWKKELNTNI
ncbi:MAG: nicotinamide riboside transporter PnuC [Bacteroidales bacterium]|nr:nicotinamide riboside transporter PnuC [Bacteroidales bacterium]MCF8327520.1 nicotinamide riboside transporter PnuC [Bacteroidales bacterium]